MDELSSADFEDYLEAARSDPVEVAAQITQRLEDEAPVEDRSSLNRGRLLTVRAQARFELGHLALALDDAREAIGLLEAAPPPHPCLIEAASIYGFLTSELGTPGDSMKVVDRLVANTSGADQIKLRVRVARTFDLLGDADAARRHYDIALGDARELGASHELDVVRNNRAIFCMEHGQLDLAQSEFELLLEELPPGKTTPKSLVIDHNLGVLMARQGRLAEALKTFTRVNSDLDRIDSVAVRGEIKLDQALLLLDYGLRAEGLALLAQARRLFERAAHRGRLVDTSLMLARVSGREGDWHQGESLVSEALTAAMGAGLTEGVVSLAEELLSWWPGRVRDDYDSRIVVSAVSVGVAPSLWLDLALGHYGLGNAPAALQLLSYYLDGEPAKTYIDRIEFEVARCYRFLITGDRQGSIMAGLAGLRLAWAQASLVGAAEPGSTLHRRVDDLRLALDISFDQDYPELAVQAVEITNDVIIPRGAPANSDDRSLLERIRFLRSQHDQAASTPAGLRELVRLESELRATSLSRGGVGPSRRVLPGPPPAAVVHLQMGPSLITVISTRDAKSSVIGRLDRSEVERFCRRVGTEMASMAVGGVRPDTRLLRRLGAKLFAPLIDHLAGVESVTICPDVRLPLVPRSLFVDTSVALVPRSFRGAGQPRNPPSSFTTIWGPGLEHASEEARLVSLRHRGGTTVGGEAARCGAVLGELSTARSVHIAAHGLSTGDNVALNSLSLSDGQLSVAEIIGNGAIPRHLVLSSCSLSKDSLWAISLGQSMTEPPSLVASSGVVSDRGSKLVMSRYHELLADGLVSFVSLRRAQAELVDRYPSISLYCAFGAG